MSIFNTTIRKFSLHPSNVRTFLFFLGCTSLLWILIQFSKKYTREIEVHVSYQELPKGMLLNTKSDTTVKMLLHGNGFRLLHYAWRSPSLRFKMSDAIPAEANHYYFLFEKQKELIKHKLDFEGQIMSIQNDTIKVILEESLQKKVPVQVTTEIDYADGYGSGDGIQIEPDSITIIGPKHSVDTIRSIQAEAVSWTKLNTDYSTTLPLQTSKNSLLTCTPNVVTASVKVSKFTEGSLAIPIQIQNAPKGKKIKIFPKKVTIVYKVALDQYNTIHTKDFTAIADYNSRIEERSFLTVTLTRSPPMIHDLKLQKREVHYVVLK